VVMNGPRRPLAVKAVAPRTHDEACLRGVAAIVCRQADVPVVVSCRRTAHVARPVRWSYWPHGASATTPR